MGLMRDEDAPTQSTMEQQQRAIEQQRQQLAQEARALEQQRLELERNAARPAAVEQPPGWFGPGPEVGRVGVRMPEFTPTDPELWFNIVDRSFSAAGITVDATKF